MKPKSNSAAPEVAAAPNGSGRPMRINIEASATPGVSRVMTFKVRVPSIGKWDEKHSNAHVAQALREIADHLEGRQNAEPTGRRSGAANGSAESPESPSGNLEPKP